MPSNASKITTRKKPVKLEFNAEKLIGRLSGYADHLQGKKKLTLRMSVISLPAPIKGIKPKEIYALRESLHLSQPLFARALNVPNATLRSWEKGRRKPTGAALRLLDIIRHSPQVLIPDLVV